MRNVSDAFAAQIVTLAEAYGKKLNEPLVRFYYGCLSDIDPDALSRAMVRAAQECKYFPTVAEIRQFAGPSTDDAALLAWAGFQRAASSVGAWSPLVCEDGPAGDALVATFGGWAAYCEADSITVTAKRNEFVAAYRQARRDGRRSYTTVLPGLCSPDGTTWGGRLGRDGQVQSLPPAAVRELVGGHARPALPEAGEPEDG